MECTARQYYHACHDRAVDTYHHAKVLQDSHLAQVVRRVPQHNYQAENHADAALDNRHDDSIRTKSICSLPQVWRAGKLPFW
jgi:hypothetical protein